MAAFEYADVGDRLTGRLIAENYDEAYWAASESLVLDRMRDFLMARFGGERLSRARMMDLGCGMGRLIPRFAPLVGQVVAIEPDAARAAAAETCVREAGLENALVLNCDSSEYLAGGSGGRRAAGMVDGSGDEDGAGVAGDLGEACSSVVGCGLDEAHGSPAAGDARATCSEGPFDVVLCSHVFQHIPHAVTQGILRDVRALLSEDGVFLMTTTFSGAAENEYSLEEFAEGERVVWPVDEEGFNAAMGRQGTLPVCRFSRPCMTSLLGEAGLRVQQFGCFHFAGEHDAARDKANTADPFRRPDARDSFYVAVPVSASGVSFGKASDLCKRSLSAASAGRSDSRGFPDASPTASALAAPAAPAPAALPITATAKVCFMQYFSLKNRLCLRHAPDHVYRLDSSDRKAGDVEGEFATAEAFLYGGGLRFPTQRFVLAGWQVKVSDAAGAPLPIRSSHVVVSLCASVGICQIDLCLNLDETGVENLVYLHQIQTADGIRFEFVREGGEDAGGKAGDAGAAEGVADSEGGGYASAADAMRVDSAAPGREAGFGGAASADGASASFSGAAACEDAEGVVSVQRSRLVRHILETRFLSVPELCRQILEDLNFAPAGSSSAYLVEVNRMREGDSDPAEPERLSARQRGSLYGILTGDEGWQYAPAALVEDRMANSWSTRSFVKAIVFSNNYVLVNFNRGALARDYEAFQNETGARFYGGVNTYFLQDAQTAGVNHGLFFSVETSMIVRTISVRLLAERPETTSGRFGFLRGEITRSRQYRSELISVLEEMNRFEISELGELDVLVARSLSVQERTESIREMLELTESDLDLKYQTNTNALVTLLTVIGLVFAAIQVIQAFWG